MTIHEAVLYHIYPLGAFGAPREHDGSAGDHRLMRVLDWIPSMKTVGANLLYLGPVFESESHGYDTLDYATVDSRLGTNADLTAISKALAVEGIELVLDGVFNHVGRGHPVVREVADRGRESAKSSWIAGFDPGRTQGGLPFGYETWAGHDGLVRLNTANPEVREFLIGYVLRWIDEFGIAGLRLDAANRLDRGFLRELARRTRERKSGFLLAGEAMSGEESRSLMDEGHLDTATNYEAFKSLWSSWNDGNYHEIAWTLKRLFSPGGVCEGKTLYSFADNHDVDRVASLLSGSGGLYPLYGLLFSMPGFPAIYYGSEYGVKGRKSGWDDGPLRPELHPGALSCNAPEPHLLEAIARFARSRRESTAVRYGNYRELLVRDRAFAFAREAGSSLAVIAVNGSPSPVALSLKFKGMASRRFRDLLDPGFSVEADRDGHIAVPVPPNWLRWLEAE